MTSSEQSVCAFTGTPDAIERFKSALTYAEAVVRTAAEANRAPETARKMTEHAEWLAWGFGRTMAEELSRS